MFFFEKKNQKTFDTLARFSGKCVAQALKVFCFLSTGTKVFLALAFMVPLPVRAQDPTPIRFVLDWKFEGEHAQFTVPLDDGTFKRAGLAVTMDPGNGSGDTVAKVASGSYDMGLADFYAMVRFNGANPGHRLIAVAMVQDNSGLGVVARSSIATPADLAGKKIATPINDGGRQLFPLFASANGIDADAIQWVNIDANLRETMLARGQSDAAIGNFGTLLSNLKALKVADSDIRTFRYTDYGIALYGSAIVVRPSFAEQHPDAVRKFIGGLAHGLNVVAADPDGAIASLLSHDRLLDGDVEKQRLATVVKLSLIDDHVLRHGFSDVDTARMDKTLQQVAPIFGLSPAPTAAQSYTDGYLPPRAELVITR